jgi:uncharacterized protein (DUF2147 family)
MKNLFIRLPFAALLLCLFISATSPLQEKGGDAALGVWLTGSGKAKIRIYKDASNQYNGKIVWLRDPKNTDGTVKVDKNNPDAGKKKTPIMGLNNLTGFVYAGDNEWSDGHIYDPENGKSYKCKMELTDAATLEVRGYIGISLFGRTDVWKRQKE